MTNQQAAQILRDHNEWRRDRSDDAPKGMPKSYNPELLGQAIDTAVKALEQPEPDELERFKATLLLLFPWESDAMRWICVDGDGEVKQCEIEPTKAAVNDYWQPYGDAVTIGRIPQLPDGIDWRDCIIERQ